MKQPFHSEVDVDDVTITCPCGKSICGEGEAIEKFMKAHRAHTNSETHEHLTDRGSRFMTFDGKMDRVIKS